MQKVLTLLLLATAIAAPAQEKVLRPTHPMPAYEVATIKPAEENERFASPLAEEILFAFGIPQSASNRLVGAPDWTKTKRYVLHTKAPDAIRQAMDKMNEEDSVREMRLMQQSLFADRLKLKVHIETRVMPIYELVPVKGGTKLKSSDAKGGGMMLRFSGQKHELKGNAVPVRSICSLLMADPEIGGRTIVDKTGLTGNYDVQMDWAPASTQEGDGPSLFAALEEQLGLKLVPTKGPLEVIVIDHIEPPSEN